MRVKVGKAAALQVGIALERAYQLRAPGHLHGVCHAHRLDAGAFAVPWCVRCLLNGGALAAGWVCDSVVERLDHQRVLLGRACALLLDAPSGARAPRLLPMRVVGCAAVVRLLVEVGLLVKRASRCRAVPAGERVARNEAGRLVGPRVGVGYVAHVDGVALVQHLRGRHGNVICKRRARGQILHKRDVYATAQSEVARVGLAAVDARVGLVLGVAWRVCGAGAARQGSVVVLEHVVAGGDVRRGPRVRHGDGSQVPAAREHVGHVFYFLRVPAGKVQRRQPVAVVEHVARVLKLAVGARAERGQRELAAIPTQIGATVEHVGRRLHGACDEV